MKKISELGLELIELEDQVLLVDNINVSESPYVLWKSKIYSNKIHSFKGVKYDECKRVIASTKPLEGLPLLVIEDDVESEYYKTHSKAGFGDYDDFPAFKEGYDKAKEIYKFTEEDLRKAIDMARKFPANSSYFPLYTTDEIIQSLTKKELWVEVDIMNKGYTDESDKPYQECCIPKITEGKIKAVWK